MYKNVLNKYYFLRKCFSWGLRPLIMSHHWSILVRRATHLNCSCYTIMCETRCAPLNPHIVFYYTRCSTCVSSWNTRMISVSACTHSFILTIWLVNHAENFVCSHSVVAVSVTIWCVFQMICVIAQFMFPCYATLCVLLWGRLPDLKFSTFMGWSVLVRLDMHNLYAI